MSMLQEQWYCFSSSNYLFTMQHCMQSLLYIAVSHCMTGMASSVVPPVFASSMKKHISKETGDIFCLSCNSVFCKDHNLV